MKDNDNEIHIIAKFKGENLLNGHTKNILLITDKEILTTMNFNDASEKIVTLIGSLLIEFGISEENTDEETFFLNQLNKIRLKDVLAQFLDDAQDYLEEYFDNKFMEEGLKKNKFYIDLEKYLEQKLNNFNKNNENEEE